MKRLVILVGATILATSAFAVKSTVTQLEGAVSKPDTLKIAVEETNFDPNDMNLQAVEEVNIITGTLNGVTKNTRSAQGFNFTGVPVETEGGALAITFIDSGKSTAEKAPMNIQLSYNATITGTTGVTYNNYLNGGSSIKNVSISKDNLSGTLTTLSNKEMYVYPTVADAQKETSVRAMDGYVMFSPTIDGNLNTGNGTINLDFTLTANYA